MLYGIPEEVGIDKDLAVILGGISAVCQTAATPANEEFSRSHQAMVFNITSTNQPCQMLLDIAGCRESHDMNLLSAEMASENRLIGRYNPYFRKLLQKLVIKEGQ